MTRDEGPYRPVAPWRRLTAYVALWALVAATSVTGCGLEHEIVGGASGDDHATLPEPADTLVHGRASAVAGGEVALRLAGGLADTTASEVREDGWFEMRLPGTAEAAGAVVWATSGDRVVAGLLPEVPRQPTIFHEERHLALWEEAPGLEELNATTTALTLAVAALAQRAGLDVSDLDPAGVRSAWDQAVALAGTPGSDVERFVTVVAALDAVAASASTGDPALRWEGLSAGESPVNPDFLLRVGVDLDGDGLAETDSLVFDTALLAASQALDLPLCFEPGVVPVVFQVAFDVGSLNGNCQVQDPYKWTSASADKRVFFVGGVHEEAPVCSDERVDHCVTQDEVDAINQQLGNWVPNQMEMADDGEWPDRSASDGVYTIAFELPALDVDASPDGAALRIGYKYTFGLPGQGWTDAEEWPGNQRLIEVVDRNGDRVVTRFDVFGDEASNKDKANLKTPSKGGCGTVTWQALAPEGCANDSGENHVDLDADCVADVWADPTPVGPLVVPCD